MHSNTEVLEGAERFLQTLSVTNDSSYISKSSKSKKNDSGDSQKKKKRELPSVSVATRKAESEQMLIGILKRKSGSVFDSSCPLFFTTEAFHFYILVLTLFVFSFCYIIVICAICVCVCVCLFCICVI